MASTPQMLALKNYRKRLNLRGMARFEVLGLSSDRELIRLLARRMADNNSDAQEIRFAVRRCVEGKSIAKGGILAALRGSPLVGADLNLDRPCIDGRKADL